MTRQELIQVTSPAEFWLAMHVRQSEWAKDFAKQSASHLAREWGSDARQSLMKYLARK